MIAAIALVLAIYRFIARDQILAFVPFGGTVVAAALLALASSPIAPKEALPPIPALQSHWLVLHVTLSFIGEAFFALGFVSAVCYLATGEERRRQMLDRLTYTAIGIGYPIFTAGALVFGAVWAGAGSRRSCPSWASPSPCSPSSGSTTCCRGCTATPERPHQAG